MHTNNASKNILTKVVFLIPPKVHLLDINGPAHIFYEAKEMGLEVELHFVSMTRESESISSAGLAFSNLEEYSNLSLNENDYILIPGANPSVLIPDNLNKNYQSFFKWLQNQNNKNVNICSICTGIFFLAAAHILRNISCTTHWRYLNLLTETYPEVTVETNRLFVKDQNIYSSAGVTSGIDLALYIIEEIADTSIVAQIAQEVVYPLRRDEHDPQLNIYLQYRNHLDNRILTVQDFLIKNLSTSSTIEDLAQQANMSSRNLTRLFKQKTGVTIHEYITKLRIEKSLHLLSEGHKIDVVAAACGLKSSNQLRNLLKKQKGVLPSTLKNKLS